MCIQGPWLERLLYIAETHFYYLYHDAQKQRLCTWQTRPQKTIQISHEFGLLLKHQCSDAYLSTSSPAPYLMMNHQLGKTMNTENKNSDYTPLLSRRRWLQGTLALIVTSLTGSVTLQALANAPSTDALTAFMTLSQALTAPHHLNPEVGRRLYQALSAHSASFSAQLIPLSGALAANTLTPEQEALALQILQAWYLGTVNDQVITYEHALMFAASKDSNIIRSYCSAQPGFWASKPGEA